LISSSIFVKMFAPNGDMLANSNYTYSIFKPKEIAFGAHGNSSLNFNKENSVS